MLVRTLKVAQSALFTEPVNNLADNLAIADDVKLKQTVSFQSSMATSFKLTEDLGEGGNP